MVKGRNEPVNIVHVAQVVANVKNLPLNEVSGMYAKELDFTLLERMLTYTYQRARNRSIQMFKFGIKSSGG